MGRWIFLMILLVPCTVRDLLSREIPVFHVICVSIAGAVLQGMVFHEVTPAEMIVGLLEGTVFLGIAFFSREQLGLGDGLMLAGAGLLAGGRSFPVILFTGFLLAAAGGIFVVIRRKNPKVSVPFAPFLTASAAVSAAAEMIAGFLK